MRVHRPLAGVLVPALLAACGSGQPEAAGAAGLATTIDSTGDSVIAMVKGAVPAVAVRRLTEVMRIAPGADDTTLFTEVRDFEVDPGGRIWAYDRPSNSIFLFAADGRLLRHIGRQGAGPGEFNSDNGMVVLGDSGLAIWDARNARISFLDSAGVFRTSWSTPTGFFTSNGLFTDHTGTLFLKRAVTAPREGEILGRMGLIRLKPGGALGDSLAPPDLPVPRDVYVATVKSGQSSMSSAYAPNYAWTWHPGGYFLAADGGKYEIVIARPAGKPIVIRRQAPPVAITAAERDEEHADVLYSMRQTDPHWSWSGPPIPSTKAPLDAVFASRDGRIWARVAAPSERISDADLTPARDPNAPISHFRSLVVYEVFGPDGRFLGRIGFPRRSTLMEADGDLVWALGRDENDLPAIVRYRIEPSLR